MEDASFKTDDFCAWSEKLSKANEQQTNEIIRRKGQYMEIIDERTNFKNVQTDRKNAPDIKKRVVGRMCASTWAEQPKGECKESFSVCIYISCDCNNPLTVRKENEQRNILNEILRLDANKARPELMVWFGEIRKFHITGAYIYT